MLEGQVHLVAMGVAALWRLRSVEAGARQLTSCLVEAYARAGIHYDPHLSDDGGSCGGTRRHRANRFTFQPVELAPAQQGPLAGLAWKVACVVPSTEWWTSDREEEWEAVGDESGFAVLSCTERPDLGLELGFARLDPDGMRARFWASTEPCMDL